MAITRKAIMYSLSITYLVLLTVLSGYATSRAGQLSLPIPRGLAYSTTILPLVSATLLELGHITIPPKHKKLQHKGSPMNSPFSIISHILVIVYSTTVITLLGTYAAPLSEMDCSLRGQWSSLFRDKNDAAIRLIQDTLQCCGFASSRDMAWPFPDKAHGGNACEVAFGRVQSCLEGWKGEERRLAGILMAVVGLVSLWQVCFVLFRTRGDSWLHQIVPGGVSRLIDQRRSRSTESFRQRIAYPASSERYSDRVDASEDNDENADEAQRLLHGNVESVGTVKPDETRSRRQEQSTGTIV